MKQAEVDDQQYNFHTVHTEQSFSNGIHILILKINPKSNTDVKIGVSKKTAFNLKTDFCDYKFGWGLNCFDGSLRHDEESSPYCEPLKPDTIIQTILNMDKGTLDFIIDGERGPNLGFNDSELWLGPIHFAVALFNKTSVTILN